MLRLRVTAGLSQRDLAGELHRVASTISELENDWRLPSEEILKQYETYFKLAPDELVGALREARGELPEAGGQVVRRRGRKKPSPDDPCPYKGLPAFEREDAALFFGREAQVERVMTRLAESRFVAVVGASGSGKSSFVRAGLQAQLATSRTAARVVVLTPREHPLDELADAVSAATGNAVAADDLRTDPGSLERATRPDGEGSLVIVVDQLEELFTLCRDEAERRVFVEALIGAWHDPASAIVVIVALRADFYGRVAAYPRLAAAVVAHQTLVGPLSRDELRRAIALPADRCHVDLQDGLVETMLDELADQPGALPLLSHALLETWKLRATATLTLGDYRKAGGVRDAIARTAERTLQGLDEADRVIARSIFLSLTDLAESSEPTLRHADRADLAVHPHTAAPVERVLGILARERLVTIDERTVAVAHEALIRHWPRLRRWIDTDRAGLLLHRRLSDDARQWDEMRREPGALYRGARLAAAREWASGHAGDLGALEREFIAASEASARGELVTAQRRARRLRVLAIGLGVLSLTVAMLAIVALKQRGDARQQATEATAVALASAALPLTDSRPDIGLLLATHGYRLSARAETRASVLAGLMAASDPGVTAILHGHSNPVSRVVFSPGSRLLASAGLDSTIRLWTAHAVYGKTMRGHEGYVVDLAFSPDGLTLASAGLDGTIRLWNVRTQKQLGAPLDTNSGAVLAVAFSPDGRTLASAGAGGAIRLWDWRTRTQLGVLTHGSGDVYSVTFSRDGKRLASAGADRAIRLWTVSTREQLGAALTGHDGPVVSVAFARGGDRLASAGGDEVRVWSVRTGRLLVPPLVGHDGDVNSVMFRPDSRVLASAGLDGTIRLWSVRSGQPRGDPLRGHAGEVLNVVFGPGGGRLASAGYDNTIRLWSPRKHRRAGRPLVGHTGHIADVAFSPDSDTLASAGEDGTIRLWSARTHEQIAPALTEHRGAVYRVAFSPDGRVLASAGADRTIRLWDLREHRPLGRPMPHESYVRSMAFSDDGRRLASAGSDKLIRLWDVGTSAQPRKTLLGHTDSVSSVAFSRDGTRLASASIDRTIRFWDVDTGTEDGEPLTPRASDVFRVAFSLDGERLASLSPDERIVWDVRARKRIGPPDGDIRRRFHLASSSDGRRLASPGPRKTVRLRDVRTHEQLGTPLTGMSRSARIVAESPDGHTVAAVGADNTIRLWEGLLWRSRKKLQKMVCDLAGGRLSRAEWNRYAGGSVYRETCL